jgi:hypothetical protein
MHAVSMDLTRAVESAQAILPRLTEEEASQTVLDGGWSRKQLLGHLIDSASNNHQRFVRAALADSLEFPAYDTPGSVRVECVQEAPWGMLVDLWAAYNRYLAHVIAHLPQEKLGVQCRIGTNDPVTLAFLAEDYVRHMVHHLRQIGAA